MKQKYRLIGAVLFGLIAFLGISNGIDIEDLWKNDLESITYLIFINALSIFMILYNESIFKQRTEK